MQVEYRRHSSARMFENDFLEACSRIHPAVPFLFYTPIVVGLLGWALWTKTTTLGLAAVAVFAGWVTWCLMEYGIHRYFFHWEGSGPLTRRIHDIAHGYHHNYPDDTARLVMPLGASIPLAILIGGGLWLLERPEITVPYFCGIVLGYLVYDFLHWASHARTPKTAWGKALRAHHMAHHFACPDKNYGISHRWVDVVMGSLRRREDRSEAASSTRTAA